MEGLFDWIAQSTPSLLSWWIGLGVAVASLWVGLSGLYRRLRGRQPHPMVANPWWSVFYLVFGAWVIWVFAISPAP